MNLNPKSGLAIEAIYDSACVPEQWPPALDAIAACFDAAGTVLLMRKRDGSTVTVCSKSLDNAALDYAKNAWKHDILASRMMERGILLDSASYTDRQLATQEEIATHPFYTGFRARNGLGSVIAANVSPHPHLPVVVAVQGKLGQPAYSVQDVSLFEYLSRHVEKALMLTVRLLEADRGQQALSELLGRLSCGVYLLDAKDHIVFQNTLGMELLGGELVSVNGCLNVIGDKQRNFLHMCQSASYEDHTQNNTQFSPMVLEASKGRHVVLHVLPIGTRPFVEDVFATSRVLVMAIEHVRTEPSDPALVRDLLGLTLGEARLASLVGSGQSPRIAASKLNITEETARTVLKRVFFKTGVSRQSELAVLLSNVSLKV